MKGVQSLRSAGVRHPAYPSLLWLLALKAILFAVTVCTGTTVDESGTQNGQPDISSICPGVEYFTEQTNPVLVFYDNMTDCDNITLGFTSGQGMVYGRCKDSRTFCHLHIQVPHGRVVRAKLLVRERKCKVPRSNMYVYDSLPSSLTLDPMSADFSVTCYTSFYETDANEMLFSSSNHMYVSQYNMPQNKITFQDIERELIFLNYTSSHSGYVTLKIPDGINFGYLNEWKDVHVPLGHLVVIIVKKRFVSGVCQVYVKIYHEEHQILPSILVSVCHDRDIPARVFNTTRVQVNLSVPPRPMAGNAFAYIVFKYYPKDKDSPSEAHSILNCHSNNLQNNPDYCTNDDLCERGQGEEEHCPTNIDGCVQWMASHKKCIQFVGMISAISFQRAQEKCQRSGGNFVSLKTRNEWIDFRNLSRRTRYDHSFGIMIGLLCGWYSAPFMYSQFCKWSDNTMLYYMDEIFLPEFRKPIRTQYYTVVYQEVLFSFSTHKVFGSFACEYYPQTETLYLAEPVTFPGVQHPSSMHQEAKQALNVCPDGHFTHSFLLCDHKSHCGQVGSALHCMIWNDDNHFKQKRNSQSISVRKIVTFTCYDELTTVPYTLLCDFRQDCPDDSDESFCEHPPCHGFHCTNGQCVMTDKRCNEYSDCLDDSDEVDCPDSYTKLPSLEEKQPVVINLDGTGSFTQQKMEANESCPDTHYRCTSEWRYCLPVYTWCNGFYDCFNHEDEQDCERATCPGFYQCRASSVCVHMDHLCDGWGQCPQRDDEWMCGMTCPVGCLCQGLSFVCSQPFFAFRFPQVRYLDAMGSGMTTTDLGVNTYLVGLSLSYCSLVSVFVFSCPNLQFLDLSNNKFTNISVNVFLGLPNLRVLLLAVNPIMSVLMESSNLTQNVLRKVDLSQTYLTVFDSETFMNFQQIQSLNISFSAIQTIGSGGFQKTPQLIELDLRGNTLSKFPFDMFLGLNSLATILSSNYRICCKEITTKPSNEILCVAPQAVLSSCEHMLPSELYRIVFWCVSVLAVGGNIACFISQCVTENDLLKSSFIVFISNLQCANSFMGIHASIIAIANDVFRGKYLTHENIWKNSLMCKMAGFVSLLSGEVSVLIIWFMTLDHIIVLCLPSNTLRLNKRSTSVVCGVTWLFALALASLPLLPGPSHLDVYGQTSLCHLVLLDKDSSKEDSDLLLFIMAFNVILCLMTGVGQVIIFRATPRYRMTADSIKKSARCSQDLLVDVGVTTVVCWSPVSIISLMTIAGVAVSDKLNVVMAVFMLPLNSTLYPILYYLSRANSKRQQEKEERLLRALKSRLKLPKTNTPW